jgi:hypothetical protein
VVFGVIIAVTGTWSSLMEIFASKTSWVTWLCSPVLSSY